MDTPARNRGRTARLLVAPVVLWVAAPACIAQWTVVSLHPAGATVSHAYGVHGATQVGQATFAGVVRPGRWTGSAATWVDLAPGANGGVARGAYGGRQVGTIYPHASLWSGTAQSWVSLLPAGGYDSFAYGIDADQQVGMVRIFFGDSLPQHASLWRGSPESWVDLTPPGAFHSTAYGVHAGQQVGEVDGFAGLWTGTAASYVPLNPAGSGFSAAYGVHNGQQVGDAGVGPYSHASLWTGTAASWTDLNPVGLQSSTAQGVFAGRQVGAAVVGSSTHASLWGGTAASWVDLHTFLPAVFTSSEAYGIWHGGGVIYIVGEGKRGTSAPPEALLWVALTPCYVNCDSSTMVPVLNIADFACFLNAFAAGDSYANCDGSTAPPVLTISDFACFLNAFAAGCG